VEGKVVDYLARPVEGAKVVLYEEPDLRPEGRRVFHKLAETESLPDGRFSLTAEHEENLSPGQRWMIVHKHGLAMGWTAEGFGVRDVVVVLGKSTSLAGVVVDEIGRPVGGARMSLCLKNEMMEPRELSMPEPEDWHVQRTDEEGRFRFDDIPPGATADFQVSAPGRASFWTCCGEGIDAGEQYLAGRTDIRIVLPLEARIEGRVFNEDNDQAVSDVRVLARSENLQETDYSSAPVTVDPDGRFVLTGLRPGSHQLQVIALDGQTQSWFGHNPVLTVQGGKTTADVTLGVNQGAILEVMICEPDSDTGVEGGQVRVSSDFFDAEATTDANGLARIRVPSGQCLLSAGKPGRGESAWKKRIDMEKGRTWLEQTHISLLPVHVAGTVLDLKGRPLAGASVLHFPFMPAPSTNDEGRFEYIYYTNGSASTHAVWIHHQSSALASMAEVNDPSNQRQLTGRIMLQPAYSLTGRVVDSNGRSIPGAYVRLVLASPHYSPRRISVLAEVITDANGVYEIRGVPVPPSDFYAHYYAVVAHASGCNEASVDPVPLSGPMEEPIRLKAIVLQPTDQIVSGFIADANDNPVPGVLVRTDRIWPASCRDDATQPHRQVLSDAQGRFRMEGVCRGPIRITATTSTGREGVTETLGGETGVKIVLGQTLLSGKSSTGERVTDWAALGLSDHAAELQGKGVLLCFVDPEQRSCRHVLSQLAAQSGELAGRNVIVVAVPLSQDAGVSQEKPTNALLMAKPADDPDALRQAWGIQSLPWLVLMDENHTVRAEGFAPADLPARLAGLAADR
jgi:protocatechuate 3,4-dioxygenase beta subunit